jgi:outer membrane murein-binding lipoprotein Lpp
LRLAPRPASTVAGNGAFLAIVGGLILGGMAALLVLNTSLAQGAFELQRLQAQQSDLEVSEQALQQQVEAAQSPDALKERADQLGMVPVTVPAFLRLADGTVLGDPTPAARPAQSSPQRHRKHRTTDAAVAVTSGTDAAAPDPAARAGTDEAAEREAAPDPRAVSGEEGAEAEAAPTGDDAATPTKPAGGGHHRDTATGGNADTDNGNNGNNGNGNNGNGNGGNG